jgi:hypothetical protein
MSYRRDLDDATKLIEDAERSISRIAVGTGDQQDQTYARQALEHLRQAKRKVDDGRRAARRAEDRASGNRGG